MPSCELIDVERFLDDLTDFDAVFYKSLAKNDHSWADPEGSNQSGLVIPREYVTFFGLTSQPSSNVDISLDLEWLLDGQTKHRSDMSRTGGHNETKLRYYCGGNRHSRPEVHLTCVYNPYFKSLEDGPLLVIGRIPDGNSFRFRALIADASRPSLLEELRANIDIPEGSVWGIATTRLTSQTVGFADQEVTPQLQDLIRAQARSLYSENDSLPGTRITSDAAWSIVDSHPQIISDQVRGTGLSRANDPMATALRTYPGNLVRWLLQKVEFQLVRAMEKLHYPTQICEEIQSISADSPPASWQDLTSALAESLPATITLVKSLTQSRRSRAGNSFEWHINNLLDKYGLMSERQVGDRRIDFVLDTPDRRIELSAKTTTRERWKQLYEGVYFITLDREISTEKLQNIRDRGITLVVPEMDKKELHHYQREDGVVTFADFFDSIDTPA